MIYPYGRIGVFCAVMIVVGVSCGERRAAANPQPSELCLNILVPGEETSALWRDLAQWGFSQQPEIPSSDRITPAQAEAFLDEAAAKVPGLRTPEDWRSAGRYFQAENFHGLSGPACARANRVASTP